MNNILQIILAFKIALIMGLDENLILDLQFLDPQPANLKLAHEIKETLRQKQKMQTENIDQVINKKNKTKPKKLLSMSQFGKEKNVRSSLDFFDHESDELTDIENDNEEIKLIEKNSETRNPVTVRQKLQRRYSQLTIGKTLSLAKNSGMKIKWGINIS